MLNLKKGQKFNRWTVIGDVLRGCRGGEKRRVLCRCECGNENIIAVSRPKTGRAISCGCYQKEIAAKAQTKHGKRYTAEYRTWCAMMERCYNPNNISYKNYGGRGIKICDQWHKVETFIQDMGLKPSPKYSIDRIDNNKDYSPDNCKWSTRAEQKKNQRENSNYKFIEYKGQRKTLKQWSKDLDIPYARVLSRYNVLHWPIERVFTEPKIIGRHQR